MNNTGPSIGTIAGCSDQRERNITTGLFGLPILTQKQDNLTLKNNCGLGVHLIVSILYLNNIIKKNWWEALIWVTGHCNRAAVSRNKYGVEKTVDTH